MPQNTSLMSMLNLHGGHVQPDVGFVYLFLNVVAAGLLLPLALIGRAIEPPSVELRGEQCHD